MIAGIELFRIRNMTICVYDKNNMCKSYKRNSSRKQGDAGAEHNFIFLFAKWNTNLTLKTSVKRHHEVTF